MATPWHVLIALANPGHGHPGDLGKIAGHWQVPLPTDGNVHGWTWFYFLNEQAYRYLNVRVPHDYDTAPLWLFYGLILIWLMPWSAFLYPAVRRALPAWPRLRTHMLEPTESTNLLLLIWAALPLLFFSLSTRQEYYVLPSLPPLILLIARLLAAGSRWNNHSEEQRTGVRVVFRVLPAGEKQEFSPIFHDGYAAFRTSQILLILGTLLSFATIVFLFKTKAPAPNTDLATLLQQNPGDYALSFGHFLDLNAQALGLFRVPLALTAGALFFGPLANYLLRRARRPHAATLALAAAAPAQPRLRPCRFRRKADPLEPAQSLMGMNLIEIGFNVGLRTHFTLSDLPPLHLFSPCPARPMNFSTFRSSPCSTPTSLPSLPCRWKCVISPRASGFTRWAIRASAPTSS